MTSSVTESYLEPGSFTLDLRPDTPKTILDLLALLPGPAGHSLIVVTDARIPPAAVEDLLVDPYETNDVSGTIPWGGTSPLPDGVVTPRWTGIIQSVDAPQNAGPTIAGGGLLALLGDDNRGQLIDHQDPIDDLFPLGIIPEYLFDYALEGSEALSWSPSPLRRRYLFLPEDMDPVVFGDEVKGWLSRITLLDLIANHWGLDYVCRPHGFIDMGPTDLIFGDPLVLISPDAGHDTLQGLTAVDVDVTDDLYDWVKRQLLANQATTADVNTSQTYVSPFRGTPLEMTQYSEATDTTDGFLATAARVMLDDANHPHRTVKVDTTDWAGHVQVGQTILLYSPGQRLTGDVTQPPIRYRGDWLFPVSIRATSKTWPITAGHGVYWRYWDNPSEAGGTVHIVDLTDYVVLDPTAVTNLEVGNPTRTLLPRVPNTVVGAPPAEQVPATDPDGNPTTVQDQLAVLNYTLTHPLKAAYTVENDDVVAGDPAAVLALTLGTPSSITQSGDAFFLPNNGTYRVTGTITGHTLDALSGTAIPLDIGIGSDTTHSLHSLNIDLPAGEGIEFTQYFDFTISVDANSTVLFHAGSEAQGCWLVIAGTIEFFN